MKCNLKIIINSVWHLHKSKSKPTKQKINVSKNKDQKKVNVLKMVNLGCSEI